MIITFAPQIMSLWIGDRSILRRSESVLQILAVGAFATIMPGFHSRCCTARIALTSRRNCICSIFRSTRCSCGYVFALE